MEEIRDIPIAVFPARMGYEPVRRQGGEYWCLAPYREECATSFQLNARRDIWYDFGAGQGGDIFTLVGEFIGSGDLKAQVRFITEIWGGLVSEHKTVFRSRENDREDSHRQESFTKVQSGPLHNRAPSRYLTERGVSGDMAMPNYKEIRYVLHGKRYFAIDFRNANGGYEVRNRFFRTSLSPKDISLMDNGLDTCSLSEGFIDCLSWMQLELGCGGDYLAPNPVASLEHSFPVPGRYERVSCYLDWDEAGRRALRTLRRRYADEIVDCSSLCKGYEGLNEYLQDKSL